ncbi:hypothetical protein VIN01S_08530 [Vibrio inusitatus NBRC 102082]|uniref:Uncharacterized protein n=1 Tax=Vibrio inusitatus NBRC 102082 TaxID=1219070 RepID=A0A4Y3HSD3_9VIBR|nr:hypothetical protein [Vibrio inusitatus]GEA50049.1 hypothetical protein VIN01S_08530 [Vibrio inusitatus NBRC 102082]
MSTSLSAAPWMQRENYRELGLFLHERSPCHFSKDEVRRKIEGELVRASVKVNLHTDLHIDVVYSCADQVSVSDRVTGISVAYDIRFGTRLEDGTFVLYDAPSYGRLFTGPKNAESARYFSNQLATSVSYALTDYLKANLE